MYIVVSKSEVKYFPNLHFALLYNCVFWPQCSSIYVDVYALKLNLIVIKLNML
jgi:hypothetical protein